VALKPRPFQHFTKPRPTHLARSRKFFGRIFGPPSVLRIPFRSDFVPFSALRAKLDSNHPIYDLAVVAICNTWQVGQIPVDMFHIPRDSGRRAECTQAPIDRRDRLALLEHMVPMLHPFFGGSEMGQYLEKPGHVLDVLPRLLRLGRIGYVHVTRKIPVRGKGISARTSPPRPSAASSLGIGQGGGIARRDFGLFVVDGGPAGLAGGGRRLRSRVAFAAEDSLLI
jgi:hypothetical protein